LIWTQYKLLIRIDDADKRNYYIEESIKNNWTARQMERQINSNLYERLLLSSDKESVMALARGEKAPDKPTDIIKDPMILEFLQLKREPAYYEKDLENAIITHLHDFLLELGNGFAFISRQQRIHLEGDEFFIEKIQVLVFCFVQIKMIH
jgi:predicted nuclease of restriction endonuclease-like (RecB) superfamily